LERPPRNLASKTTGVKANFIDKSGSWYSYKNQRIGQGRENARMFLKDNPMIAKEIEDSIRANVGIVSEQLLSGEVAEDIAA